MEKDFTDGAAAVESFYHAFSSMWLVSALFAKFCQQFLCADSLDLV